MIISQSEFNETFSENYDTFRYYTSTVMTNNYSLYNDGINDERVIEKVHDVYERIMQRVTVSAVTASTIIGYIKNVIRHAIYDDVRPDLVKNRIKHIHLGNDLNAGYHKVIEDVCYDNDTADKQHLQYRETSMYLSKKMFQYIELRYNEKQQYIFKCYFLMTKKMTYQRLSEQTGYSIAYCSLTIKKIKRDLRNNFNNWLKDNS